MDSKRRMVEMHIWNQPFYSELSQTEKLFYWFIITKCDNVGVYKHNPRLASFHCGDDIDFQTFVSKINFDEKRIEVIKDHTLWIKDFVQVTWSTLAAGNNLGVSCYKLLVKHNLLERFISEYPNCINIASFRDAIKEGKKGHSGLPLPQACPSLDPKHTSNNRIDEPQSYPKAGTINITNNKNNSINKNTNLMDQAERILQAYPKRGREDTEIAILATIESLLKSLKSDGIKNPENYLLEEINRLDKKNAPPPGRYFESISKQDEVPF